MMSLVLIDLTNIQQIRQDIMLQEANSLNENQNFSQARDKYLQFIASNPTNGNLLIAYNNLAMVYDSLGNHLQSVNLYQKIIDIDPNYRNGKVYLDQGENYQMAKLYRQSINAYLKFLKFQPSHSKCHYNIALAHNVLKQESQAQKYLIKAIQFNPSFKRPYQEMITILKGRKEYEEIIKICTAFLKHEPTDFGIMYEEGFALLMLKRYNQAASAFNDCLCINKQYIKSHLGLGETYFRLEKYTEALELLTNCLQTKQQIANSIQKKQIKLLISLNYEKLEKIPEAINMLRQIVNQKPINEMAKVNFARLLQKEGNRCLKKKNFSESLIYYTEALKYSPSTNTHLFNNIGLAYQNINNFLEAENYFNKVLKIQSKNQHALNNIGALHRITGRGKEAEEIFRSSCIWFAQNPNLTANLGKMHMENRKYKEALNQFLKAQKLIKSEDNYGLYNDISVALEKLNRYQEALEYSNKANSLSNQKSPLLLFNRANIWMKLNKMAQAKRDFSNAAAILRNPNKSYLLQYGISELNLRFMNNQVSIYAHLMEPINQFRQDLMNDLSKCSSPVNYIPFPKVVEKIQNAQLYIISQIIPRILKSQSQQKQNTQQIKKISNEVRLMKEDIKKQLLAELKRQNKQQIKKALKQGFQSRDKKLNNLIKKLKIVPQTSTFSKRLDELNKKDKVIWKYGKQLYWILSSYLKSYMMASTGIVAKGDNINLSQFSKIAKAVGGFMQLASNIPIVGQITNLITKVCGFFIDMEVGVITDKIFQIISINYNTEQQLNNAICQAVLIFINNQNKINRVRHGLLFKPSKGLLDSIKTKFDELLSWFNEKKAELIMHARGLEKCQMFQQYQFALIDVGTIIALMLKTQSNSNKKYPVLTTIAKKIVNENESVQKLIVESYQRQKQDKKETNNGFCQIM